jgi:hypothetical protein
MDNYLYRRPFAYIEWETLLWIFVKSKFFLGFAFRESFSQVKEFFVSYSNTLYFQIVCLTLRLEGSYEDLIGIDSAYVLSILTGGMVLRFNPTFLNDQEPILHYLNHSKAKNFIVGVIGSELVKVHFSKANYFNFLFRHYISFKRIKRTKLIWKKKLKVRKQRKRRKLANALGIRLLSSMSFIYRSTTRLSSNYITAKRMLLFHETIETSKCKMLSIRTLSFFVFLRLNVNLFYRENEKILNESLPNFEESMKKEGTMYFSYEEFFEYFEIFSIVVLLNDSIPSKLYKSLFVIILTMVKRNSTT